MKNAPAVGSRGARRDSRAADVCGSLSTPTALRAKALRAELIGDTCTAAEITARCAAPALALCRLLIEAGNDPARPLHVYRGNMLCLRVRTIGEGARMRVAPHGVGFERLPECTAASPARSGKRAGNLSALANLRRPA